MMRSIGEFMRPGLLLLFAMALSWPVLAETAEVERLVAAIRTQYNAIGARIAKSEAKKPDDAEGTGITRSELVINKDREPWRAVGIYRVVYTFWFHEAEEPVSGNSPQRLRKATVVTEISARRHYQEFFYGDDGALAFYFRRAAEGEAPAELRLYFNKQRPIRALSGGAARDSMNAQDLKAAPEILSKSAALRRLFDESLRTPVE